LIRRHLCLMWQAFDSLEVGL